MGEHFLAKAGWTNILPPTAMEVQIRPTINLLEGERQWEGVSLSHSVQETKTLCVALLFSNAALVMQGLLLLPSPIAPIGAGAPGLRWRSRASTGTCQTHGERAQCWLELFSSHSRGQGAVLTLHASMLNSDQTV